MRVQMRRDKMVHARRFKVYHHLRTGSSLAHLGPGLRIDSVLFRKLRHASEEMLKVDAAFRQGRYPHKRVKVAFLKGIANALHFLPHAIFLALVRCGAGIKETFLLVNIALRTRCDSGASNRERSA